MRLYNHTIKKHVLTIALCCFLAPSFLVTSAYSQTDQDWVWWEDGFDPVFMVELALEDAPNGLMVRRAHFDQNNSPLMSPLIRFQESFHPDAGWQLLYKNFGSA